MAHEDHVETRNDVSAPVSDDGSFDAATAEVEQLRMALARAETRERALGDEVRHRVRNMLSTIRSVYRQSLDVSTDTEEFVRHFQGRLDAIARRQTHSLETGQACVEIEDLVREELLQTRYLDGPHCSIEGPPARLSEKQAETMGLAIHELATNAVKFGAFAQDGMLSVSWSVEDDLLHFRWVETGVAIAAPAPRASGFGRQLIEEALPYQLGATTRLELRPGGMECVIDLPLQAGATVGIERNETRAGGESVLPAERDMTL